MNESKAKITQLEKEEEFSRIKTIYIALIAIFILVLAIFIIFKLKSDSKKKQKINALSMQMYEASIENQAQRLTEASLSLTRKKEFSEDLITKISEIEGINKQSLVSIKQYISNEVQIDESILETEKLISEINEEFFLKLKQQFPRLTENDIRLCGFIRLKLSLKQIAVIKNITPESVKIAKNRLGKKLKLDSSSDIQEFLTSLN